MASQPTTSPWRTPAALAATRDLKLSVLSKARKGPGAAGVDLKMLIFLVPHACIPLSLFHIGTPFGRRAALFWAADTRATPADVAVTLLALLLLGVAFVSYFRVYDSNPGWVPDRFPGTLSSAGHCRHDRWTGQCVHKMDHYCWFLSTTIGDSNHCWFWFLLLADTALSYWLLLDAGSSGGPCAWAAALQRPLPQHCAQLGASRGVLLSLLLPMAAAAAYFFTHLFLLHTYLACTNQTTLELLKGIGMPYLYPFYVTHEGPLSYQVLTCGHLWNVFMHELHGTGPPKPFSQGLLPNLRVFFLARKPHNYVYQRDPPQLAHDEGDATAQVDAGRGGSVQGVGSGVV